MENWLFDGQGVEFHHFQRAKQAQNQAETNHLLREQNALLRQAESARQQAAKQKAELGKKDCPECPHCAARIAFQPDFCDSCRRSLYWDAHTRHPFPSAEARELGTKDCPACPTCGKKIAFQPSKCCDCETPLFWAVGVTTPFTTVEAYAAHSKKVLDDRERQHANEIAKQHQRLLETLPTRIEKRIDTLTEAAQWIDDQQAGKRLSKAKRADSHQRLDATRSLFDLVMRLQQEAPATILPAHRIRQLSVIGDLLAQIGGSLGSLAPDTLLDDHRRLVGALAAAWPSILTQSSALASAGNRDESPDAPEEASPRLCNTQPLIPLETDPSGVIAWFAGLAFRVMASLAVADRKLRSAEVGVIAQRLRTIGVVAEDDHLQQLIIAECKNVAGIGAERCLQAACEQLRPFCGSRPAVFIVDCALAVAAAEGSPADPEKTLLATLTSSLNKASSMPC